MHGVIRDFQNAFARLQNAADDVWQPVDEVSSLLPDDLSVAETNDPVKDFNDVRNIHSNTLKICDALQSFAASWKDKANNFAERTEILKRNIDSTARGCGLRRLPDELLVDILDRAADSFEFRDRLSFLKSSARLSHVCKRFRRTLVLSSKYWTEQTLISTMPTSIILDIIERYRSRPLKAKIVFDDIDRPTSNSGLIKAIVDLGARLDELVIKDSRTKNSSTFLELSHALSPRTLTCYRCLTDPSLSRKVVSCTLDLSETSLKLLLRSLSWADNLEVLTLKVREFTDQDGADSMQPISLPSLKVLRLRVAHPEATQAYHHLMRKIVSLTVPSLDITFQRTHIAFVYKFIYAQPSIRDLRLNIHDGYGCFPSIPQRIETLELSGQVKGTIDAWLVHPKKFPMQNLRCLKFSYDDAVSTQILRLRDLFVKRARNQVQFKFHGCSDMKDGMYELAEVHNAVRSRGGSTAGATPK